MEADAASWRKEGEGAWAAEEGRQFTGRWEEETLGKPRSSCQARNCPRQKSPVWKELSAWYRPPSASFRQLRGKWDFFSWVRVCMLSCVQPCNPMDCSPPVSSVHGILQARIQEWVAMPFSRDLPDPRIKPWWVSCIAGGFFTAEPHWVWLPSVPCAWMTYFGVTPSATPQGRPSYLSQRGDSGSASPS